MSGARLTLGTYRCRDVRVAAEHAAAAGADWFDTAANYRGGTAEAVLAPVLASRPGIGVSTKAGFVPAGDRDAARAAGALTAAQARAGHCLAPSWLDWQIDRSRERLGRAPDLVFVHNPEHHASDDRDLDADLAAAFAVLEGAARAGRIGGYGVATWNGFATGVLTIPALLDLAARAAPHGCHQLRAVQLPLSLVHLEPVARALEGSGPLAEARRAGLEVFAAAPLHGGALATLVPPVLAELILPGATPAQAALAVVASAPGVHRVLLSAGSPQHWDEAADALTRTPVPLDRLRKAIDVLGT